MFKGGICKLPNCQNNLLCVYAPVVLTNIMAGSDDWVGVEGQVARRRTERKPGAVAHMLPLELPKYADMKYETQPEVYIYIYENERDHFSYCDYFYIKYK